MIVSVSYLNPFYLEQKFGDATNRDKVEILWSCFIPNEFYFYICQGENYQLLNKITLKYITANKIVCDYVNQCRINSLTTFLNNTRMYTNLLLLHYFPSTFGELIIMLYRADESSKQRL